MRKILFTYVTLLIFIPANAQCWKQIDAGGFFTLGIKDDGTLWGWGDGWAGVLGSDEYNFYSALPIQIGDDNDWAVVSAGNGHGMALKKDGTLWTWGLNSFGELGNGEYEPYPNHVPVQIGNETWKYISAGHQYSCAIRSDGTLWTWGDNLNGELGNGELGGSFNPVLIPTQVGTDNDWKMVCASRSNTAAIKTNGTLWIAGHGEYGQIGNGQTNSQGYFTQAGSDTDWDIVTFGGNGGAAIKTDGTLWGWGYNTFGAVGNGTAGEDVISPVLISGDEWKSVIKGMNYFTGAIKKDGTLWTWGHNYYGEVGNGFTGYQTTPVQIESDIAWESYQGGGDFSVALKEDGSLWVWGGNQFDGLGFNIEDDEVLIPTQVQGACDITALVEQYDDNNSIFIYPNPVKDILNIEGTTHKEVDEIRITDISGKIIICQNNLLSLEVSNLQRGLYFIHISMSGKQRTFKFVKE